MRRNIFRHSLLLYLLSVRLAKNTQQGVFRRGSDGSRYGIVVEVYKVVLCNSVGRYPFNQTNQSTYLVTRCPLLTVSISDLSSYITLTLRLRPKEP